METPKPSDAHRWLEKLAGSWRGDEHLNPSPWDPKGGPAVGHATYRTALDGLILLHDYQQERNGAVTFRGHGVFGWDPIRSEYTLHWWDSMCTSPNEYRGSLKDGVLTLSNQGEQGHSRLITELGEEGRYTFRMDLSQDGSEWFTFMEGRYVRAAD